VELKVAVKQESYVRRTVFAEDSCEIGEGTNERSLHLLILSKKEAGVGCLLWQEVTAMFLSRCIGLIGILSKLRTVYSIRNGRPLI